MRAVLPSLTQDWKKLGATDTPRASLVMPVDAWAALLAITRNVPKSKTNRCCVYLGSDANSLQRMGKNTYIKKCRNKIVYMSSQKPCKDRLIYMDLGGSKCYSYFLIFITPQCTDSLSSQGHQRKPQRWVEGEWAYRARARARGRARGSSCLNCSHFHFGMCGLENLANE